MTQNKKLAEINTETGDAIVYAKLPIGLSLVEHPATIASSVKNITAFQDWCSGRVLMMSQKHAKKMCNALALSQDMNTANKANIAISYHCSTLNDCYWVKTYDEDVCYEDVSLFRNTSTNILTPVSLRGEASSIFRHKLENWSDIGVDGTLAKSWIREDGVYYLYKENNNAAGEELASTILDMLGVDHVSYTKVKDSGLEMTKCKCFTSEDVGFIPYRTLVKEMGENALDYVKNTFMEDFANLAVCSYLIGNENLHDKNWGLLINSDGNITGMAPMFDFDGCFVTYKASASLLFLPDCRYITEDGKNTNLFEFDIDDFYTVKGPTLKEAAMKYSKYSSIDLSSIDYSLIPDKFRDEFQIRVSEIIAQKVEQTEEDIEK